MLNQSKETPHVEAYGGILDTRSYVWASNVDGEQKDIPTVAGYLAQLAHRAHHRRDGESFRRRSRRLASRAMATFSDLFTRLDADPRVRGKQFEHVCKWFLTNDPMYKNTLRTVWLWSEWKGRWGGDAGIDLVAEDYDGRLWAIQAKAYAPENTVTKADVDKFLAESSRAVFSYRLLIATTDRLHHVARRTINDQEKQVAFVGLSDLLTSEVNWRTNPLDMRPSPPPKPARPREHQREAIRDVVKGFTKSDRGQLIMACGTGKTLTSLFIKEKLAADRTLVLVPSLSLLKQTMQVWRVNARVPFEALPVCSDETVGRSDEDAAVAHTSELGVPVTTDPHDIAAFLRRRSGPGVVFSTYQSSPQVAAAFAVGRVPAFDLVVADEAHRVAGIESSDFATVLDPKAIRARRRLFMTATPRCFTGRVIREAKEAEFEYASMDDESKFGRVFHRLGFSEAIKRKLLTDYQVAVVGVDDATYRDWAERGALVTLDGKKVTDARTVAGQIGLAKAMRKYALHRTISFHSRVARAREFASEMPEVIAWMPAWQRPKGSLWSSYASGEMSAGARHVRLQHLSRLDDGQRGLLTNARCLSEGVDVPTLDGVAFIDPRRSEVDIVQAVGRAIRKSADKNVGTIVIPVFIDSTTDAETALDGSVFKPVWDVVRALRAHDDELGSQLDELRRELGRHGGRPRLPDKIHVDLPAKVGLEFAKAFDVRLVEQTTASWEFWYGLLEEFVAREGHTLIPALDTFDGYRLGQWVAIQRYNRSKGVLGEDRKRRLEEVRGWTWDAIAEMWEEGFRRLQEYIHKYGNCSVPQKLRNEDGYPLGAWVTSQRSYRRSGELSEDRQQRLENLPGWSWAPRTDRWEEGFRRLQEYVNRRGDARVVRSYTTDDGFRLGLWAQDQRSRYTKGTIGPDRAPRLEKLPGWSWDIHADRWEIGFQRLQEYVESHGNSRVPHSYTFGGYQLGGWVNAQRTLHNKGVLSVECGRRLEELPGWTWHSSSAQWEEGFRQLGAYVELNGDALVPARYMFDGYPLGSWVGVQRISHQKGKLEAERVRRLEGVPGWSWDPYADRWEAGFRRLKDYVKRYGDARVPSAYVIEGYRLGAWVLTQRSLHKKGMLEADRERRLERLRGWRWGGLKGDAWDEKYDLLRAFAAQEGHARVPQKHVENGVKLGLWVGVQRLTRDEMTPERRARLEAVPGWSWDPIAEQWDKAFVLLKEYIKKHRTSQVPFSYEVDGVKLGQWVWIQRGRYAKGKLDPSRQGRLEKLPRWTWRSI